jgi:hypothetical protein
MKKIVGFVILSMIVGQSYSQNVYRVGALNTEGVVAKFDAEIVITDSLYVLKSGGNVYEMKIQNKTQNGIYVTDGTSVDMITISPFPGKVKGFSHTHILMYQQDKRFSGKQIVYYCILAN